MLRFKNSKTPTLLRTKFVEKQIQEIKQDDQEFQDIKTRIINNLCEKESRLATDLSSILNNTHSSFSYKMRECAVIMFKLKASERLPDLVGEYRKGMNVDKRLLTFFHSGFEELPWGTIFIAKNFEESCYVIEYPPEVRTIKYKKSPSYEDPTHYPMKYYEISMPYLIFFLKMMGGVCVSMQVFFRNEKVTDASDEIFLPSLPNIQTPSANYKICFPIPSRATPNRSKLIPEYAAECIEAFLGGTFNEDAAGNMDASGKKIEQVRNFATWAEATLQNPNIGTTFKWLPLHKKYSIASFLAELFFNGQDVTDLNPKEIFPSSAFERTVKKVGEDMGDAVKKSVFQKFDDEIRTVGIYNFVFDPCILDKIICREIVDRSVTKVLEAVLSSIKWPKFKNR